MSKTDSMQTLLKLRRKELDAAQASLAERLDHAHRTRVLFHEAELSIQREFEAASRLDADDTIVEALAAWLPQGRAVATRARVASENAEVKVIEARAILNLTRTAAEAVTKLCEQRQAAARIADEARMQAALDEVGRHRYDIEAPET